MFDKVSKCTVKYDYKVTTRKKCIKKVTMIRSRLLNVVRCAAILATW